MAPETNEAIPIPKGDQRVLGSRFISAPLQCPGANGNCERVK
jgi:hypothetical protein